MKKGDLISIYDIVEKFLKPNELQKKKNGEVFTPLELIREKCYKVPEEFWKNPNVKVLDPCCGIGNYQVVLIEFFTKGLEEVIKDEKERLEWIKTKILYCVDICPINVGLCKMVTGVENVYCMDFLSCNFLDRMKFDMIIGNPPYQAVSEKGNSKGGGNNLYTKFIYKAYEILKKNGFLVFINPPTFFSIGRSSNKNEMNLKKDVFDKSYIHYINLGECRKYFNNVGSKFIYYIIQKNNYFNKSIEVVCEYNNQIYKSVINQTLLNNFDYLPYLLTNESLNICFKIKNFKGKKLNIFNSPDNRRDKKHVQDEKTEEFKYPIQATGKQIVYSSKPCKNQNNKKIIMSESGYLNPFYDNGILGIGGHCFGLLVKNENEGDNKIQLLNSKLYKFYIDINKWSGFHHKKVLQDLIDVEYENDEQLYKYFKLSDEEVSNL